ncbi:MAG: hypothetical protein L3K03_01160 [Thermoplasmata archaeon]|nr:hypothetical protein [Thermoplasmata archaeon]
MVSLDPAAFLLALVIVLIEMTEVVVLVFAINAGEGSLRHAAAGAAAGTAVVAGAAIATGAVIERLPADWLLGVAAILLAGFGIVLARSTRKAYRKAALARLQPAGTAAPMHRAVQFAGGFTAGAVETLEAVVVLLSLSAAGEGTSAVVGALTAGAILVVATFLVQERVRRIKVPQLKLFGTGMLFSFATFWAGSALGVNWPGSDLILIPFVLVAMTLVRLWVGDGSLTEVPVEQQS